MNNMKLRVCLTDVCNFSCKYCRPGGEGICYEHKSLLSSNELIKLIEILINKGFESVRLTGGEPLLRRDFYEIAKSIKKISKLKKLTMVTNGSMLSESIVKRIEDVGFKSITVSLDTIDRLNFKTLTGKDNLYLVLNGIDLLKKNNINVKINTVVQKSNLSDIKELIAFCCKHQLPLKLLDLVCMDNNYWKDEYLPLNEIEDYLKQKVNVK